MSDGGYATRESRKDVDVASRNVDFSKEPVRARRTVQSGEPPAVKCYAGSVIGQVTGVGVQTFRSGPEQVELVTFPHPSSFGCPNLPNDQKNLKLDEELDKHFNKWKE